MNLLSPFAVLAVILPAPAGAQSPTPENSQTLTFNRSDVQTLLQAGMPSYDPIVHYAGLGDNPHTAVLWVSQGTSSDSMHTALVEAMALACMADGEAVSKWKGIYDVAAGQDAQPPASAPDPYSNRHKLLQAIGEMIGSH